VRLHATSSTGRQVQKNVSLQVQKSVSLFKFVDFVSNEYAA
jgi:hypothetical protein